MKQQLLAGFVRRTLIDRDQKDEPPDVDAWVEIPVDPAVNIVGLHWAVRYAEFRHRLPLPDLIEAPLWGHVLDAVDETDREFLYETRCTGLRNNVAKQCR